MLVPRAELEKLIRVKPGEVFSRQRLTESTKAITDRLGNEGYAFANASAIPQINKEKRSVAFTIVVDPGRRVYVRRINVGGNTRTRDEVVRREMRQLEGAYYDASKIQLSKTRIDRTAYFKDVNVETAPVAESADQIDVNFTVEEKPTGALMLGAGFSSVDKLVLSGSVAQTNVFGSGKSVSVNINSGKVNKTYSLSYLNPYFTVDGVSQGFDVYKKNVDAATLAVGSYSTHTLGGAIRFGYPLSENDSITFGLYAEHVKLGLEPDSPATYVNFASSFGSVYTYGAGSVGWTRDTRDSAIVPTTGGVNSASAELGNGDLKYYRGSLNGQRYFPVSRTVTLALNGELGYVHGLSGKPVPFFKNFYLGGPGSVRGYKSYSLGPQDASSNVLGGTRKIAGNVELLFPMPGAAGDKSLRLLTFIDGGQVYGADEKVKLADIRYSAGVGVAWNSPFGPLKLSIGQPLNKKATDRIERIQFTFGSTF
jgi:outer membrane protein insertion porin family